MTAFIRLLELSNLVYSMKVGIMQPYIFPYIGYFQLIYAVDKFILLDDVHFIKRGWINRNCIIINKQVHQFYIPLSNASQNNLIKDVEISNAFNWRNKLLKTINYSYKKAPFFSSVYPLIECIVLKKEKNISKFVYYSLINILNYLAVKTSVIASSGIYNNSHLKGQERIIDICQKENASVYLNPIGGQKLYNKDCFSKKRINLFFIKSKFSNQSDKSIVPLSIIDLLMNHSKEELQSMLNDYDLE